MAIWKEQKKPKQGVPGKRKKASKVPQEQTTFQDEVEELMTKRLEAESSDSESLGPANEFAPKVGSTERFPESFEASSSNEEESVEENAFDSETENSESEEDVTESDRWGVYYGADAEGDDESLSEGELELVMKEEEEESRRLQERQLASIDKEDLDLTSFKETPLEASSLPQEKNWSSLSDEEKLRIIEKDSPELIKLLEDLQEKAGEIFHHLEPIIDKVKKFKSVHSDGMSFLELKYHLLFNYCMNIAYFMLLKSQGATVKNHPVLDQLIELRVVMEKMKPLEEKLQYQIHKLIDIAKNQNENGAVNEVEHERTLKPNPASLIANEEGSQSEEDDEDDLEHRVYRPPRIAPVVDNSRDKTNASKSWDKKRKERVEEENWKESYMEMEQLPESLRGGLISQDTEKLTSWIDAEKERQKYEEENFTRLFTEKKEQKLQRKMKSMERDSILGSEFGQEFDSLVSMADHLVSSKAARDDRPNHNYSGKDQEDDSVSMEESVDKENESSESEIEDDLSFKRKGRNTNIPSSLVPGEIPKGSRRKVQRAQLDNRGLTPKRKKTLKNPRVKHKKRYDTAQKKRKSVLKDFKVNTGVYRGESSGINISQSRK